MLHDIEVRVGDYVGFTYTSPTSSTRILGYVHGFDLSAGLMFVIISGKHAVYGYSLDQVKDLYFPEEDE
ncbi:hypothetical protein [Paenibacillus sp. UNC496MF]|uniref:hypothetical protein n=1 Tax=Paenibacillus sp. UNC496MF TaxID=1502753 RepID=UPI001C43609E|nr:hypothetical protein [Paenibacillus sp. UNC496MF]